MKKELKAKGCSANYDPNAESGQVTVRSQSGHSRVSSQVTVGSWFFTYKLKFMENQGEADDAY